MGSPALTFSSIPIPIPNLSREKLFCQLFERISYLINSVVQINTIEFFLNYIS